MRFELCGINMKTEYTFAIVCAIIVALLLIVSLLYCLLKGSRKLKEQAGVQEIFYSVGSGRIPIIPENESVINALYKVNVDLAGHVSYQFSVTQVLLNAIKEMMLKNSGEEALLLKLNEICVDIFSAYCVIDCRARIVIIKHREYNMLKRDLMNSYQDMCDVCNDVLYLMEEHKVDDERQCCAQLMESIKLECKHKCSMLQQQSYNSSVLPSVGLEGLFVSGIESYQQDMR